MRAIVFDGPSSSSERTHLRDVGAPQPGRRQLTIDVEFAGINFVDIRARRGDPGYVQAWPFRPGLEVAGTVRALGRGVTGFEVGDRVAALTRGGGLAEIATAEEHLTAAVPDRVSIASAAAAPIVLSTALLLLRDTGHLGPGESVLMHAAGGGVGSAVAQIGRALGAEELVGTVGSSAKIEHARRIGWTRAVVRAGATGRHAESLVGHDFDLILDPLGTEQLDFDIAHVAPGGRIVIFGNTGGGEFAALPPVGQLLSGGFSIGGFSITKLAATAPQRVGQALRDVLALLHTRSVDLPVQVINSLSDVAAAHDALADGTSVGKHVVDVRG